MDSVPGTGQLRARYYTNEVSIGPHDADRHCNRDNHSDYDDDDISVLLTSAPKVVKEPDDLRLTHGFISQRWIYLFYLVSQPFSHSLQTSLFDFCTRKGSLLTFAIRALYLLRKHGIAAPDTARSIQEDYLHRYKGISREDERLCRAQSPIVVSEIGEVGSGDKRVLITIWMDRTLVRMLAPAYTGQEKELISGKKPRANDAYTK